MLDLNFSHSNFTEGTPLKVDELQKALGAFLICFGQGLPPELKSRIRDRAYQMAEEIDRNGEPTVARLTRGLADALAAQMPTH